jgi:small neutral amino acid transporter SnatA (MarC family)
LREHRRQKRENQRGQWEQIALVPVAHPAFLQPRSARDKVALLSPLWVARL